MVQEEDEASDPVRAAIRWGKPVLALSFCKIKFITAMQSIMLIAIVVFSIKLFVSAVHIRTHIGYFIDMISNGDGKVLPSFQAVPVLFCLLYNLAIIYMLYNAFDTHERPILNRFMFILVLVGLLLVFILLVIVISVIVHVYGAHQSLHDGIVDAMHNYSTNLKAKVRMDQLQMEFQCCGSKKYDEWYDVVWYDSSLHKEGSGNPNDGSTPFSCCSMKSLAPCIHHDIELTGKAYLYTPEFNLSISTRGCYDILRERKQSVGWKIVGNLFIYIAMQIIIIILFRFIQTAHSILSKFDGNRRIYPAWLFGCYKGKMKKSDTATATENTALEPRTETTQTYSNNASQPNSKSKMRSSAPKVVATSSNNKKIKSQSGEQIGEDPPPSPPPVPPELMD